jgi:streptogramin lyase
MWTRSKVLSAALALLFVTAACGGSSNEEAEPPADRTASVWVVRRGSSDLDRLSLDGRRQGTVDLCCDPHAIAVTDDSVWVTTAAGHVIRIDSRTNKIIADVEVGDSASAIAVNENQVWVVADLTELVQLSTTTNKVVTRSSVTTTAAPIVDVEATPDGVWLVLDLQFALLRLDPKTGQVVERLPLCSANECRVGAAAAAEITSDTMWVVDDTAGELLTVDPTSLTIRGREKLGAGIWYIVGGSEGVFVVEIKTGRLQRVDVGTAATHPTADEVFGPVGRLATGAGSVWLFDTADQRMVRVDPVDLEEVGTFPAEDVRILAVG